MVGATGGLVAATDALEKGNHLVGGAAHNQLGYALGVAMTSSVEETVADATLGVGLHVNELAASAVTCVKHILLIKNQE